MPSFARFLVCALVLCWAPAFTMAVEGVPGPKTENSCVYCHSRLPGSSFVGVKSHGWQDSTHPRHGVTCDKCHGGNPQAAEKTQAHVGVLGSAYAESTVYYKNIPATCGKCHGAAFYKFTQSRHYRMLETAGRGPDCVTCHGSMVTGVLTPESLVAVCQRCHNPRMGIAPAVPQRARLVLLLLRQSRLLLDLQKQLRHPAAGTAEADALGEAGAALHSAILDWHRFDLDVITSHLEDFYNALQRLPPASSRPDPQP
jgi:hypothetical protein